MDSRSFWAMYTQITAKLKKRFLHKPNFSEGARDYEELKRLVRREGLPHYAAFCCLAASRCHQALGDVQAEAAQLAEAAGLYAQAERELQALVFSVDGSTVGFEENYVEALDCYQLAIQQYLKLGNAVMAVELCTELAGLVKHLAKYDEAIQYYQTAISLQAHYGIGLFQRTHSYEAVLDCLYRLRAWPRAIQTLEEYINLLYTERGRLMPSASVTSNDIFTSNILDAEVKRMLLLLIERSPRDEIYRELARLTGDSILDPSLTSIVDDAAQSNSANKPVLSWNKQYSPSSMSALSAQSSPVLNSNLYISDYLADMLEALIEACLACDMERLIALEPTLGQALSGAQRALVAILIETTQKLL